MTDFKNNDPRLLTLGHHESEHLNGMMKRGASRRDVMGWLMAAGATTFASGTLFDGLAHAAAHTPKRGGKLIMAGDQHGPNDTLDPALYTSAVDYFRGRMFYGADLPIALGTFHFKILQEGTTDFATAVGTGPYRVKEFKPGVRAVGTPFENYWGEGGYLDELEHYGIGDSTARLNAFLAGDIDAMVNLPPKAISQVVDHCPDIPQRELDPDMAKFHWEKSGLGNTPVPIVCAEVAPGAVEQCLFMQREGKKIGANFDVKKVTTDGYWGSVWLKEPICVASWNMRPTANIMMTLAFKGDADWNETRWQNDNFDQLLVDVRGETDADKRAQKYCDLQTMIHEENGMSLPVHRNYVDAAASHVKGRTEVPLNNFGGAESPVTLWRADT